MDERSHEAGTASPPVEVATDEQDDSGSEELEAASWQERLGDVEDLGCRVTTFHALSDEPRGLFRVMPLALRFLRLAAGRTQEEIGVALLGAESGTVEAIERGCIHPTLIDLDAWVSACGGELNDLSGSYGSAQSVWPAGLRTLTLPRFWGSLAPSQQQFDEARKLIEGLGSGKRESSGSEARGTVGERLVRFFEYFDEDVSPHLASVAPRAGLAELRGDEPVAVVSWWSRTLALWFNLYLVCQAPVGCRFLDVDAEAGELTEA
jgi:hypothetical protein